ncbi:MAG: ubiquinol oxidase subunit II [Rhabdochlamydiaceae bacterium]|nr:ubiquinol oxidase subunit II [Candidatus Amphrikana amoebophyrae]
MKKKFGIAIIVLIFVAIAAGLVLYVVTHDIAVLNPQGAIGKHERDLLVISSLLMLIVVVPALVLTLGIAWKYRATNENAKYTPNWGHSNLAEVIWWGVPCIIIIFLAIITYKTTHELNPFTPLKSDKKPIEIQVVALDWKWLFILKDQGVAAVNFVQFPENTPLNFEITADAPMNSFWIPQLGGQIYAMPAMRTKLHLIANAQGVFRGCSANISGRGFAGMVFHAKSSTQEEFDQWVENTRQSQNLLTFDEYEKIAEPSTYDPVKTYKLVDMNLFDQIVEKYTKPAGK